MASARRERPFHAEEEPGTRTTPRKVARSNEQRGSMMMSGNQRLVKLLRYGPKGHERPGLLGDDGIIRDLSGILEDITPEILGKEWIGRLAAMDPAALHAVAGSPRFGVPLKGIGK